MWRQLLCPRSAVHWRNAMLLHLACNPYVLHAQHDAGLPCANARCSNNVPACLQDTKRARLTYFDGDSDTDDSDAEDMPAAGAASAAAAPPEPAAAPAPAAAATVPSGGHAAPSTGPAQVTCLPLRKPTCTSTAEESSMDAGHAYESPCWLSQARLGPDTSAAAAAAVDRQASVTSPRPKSGRETSVASNAQVPATCASLPPSAPSCSLVLAGSKGAPVCRSFCIDT